MSVSYNVHENKGRKFSEEHRRKINETNNGKKP